MNTIWLIIKQVSTSFIFRIKLTSPLKANRLLNVRTLNDEPSSDRFLDNFILAGLKSYEKYEWYSNTRTHMQTNGHTFRQTPIKPPDMQKNGRQAIKLGHVNMNR